MSLILSNSLKRCKNLGNFFLFDRLSIPKIDEKVKKKRSTKADRKRQKGADGIWLTEKRQYGIVEKRPFPIQQQEETDETFLF